MVRNTRWLQTTRPTIPHTTQEPAMSTTEVRSRDATSDAGIARVDMKLEVV